jgi:hypothetical protein
VPVTCQAPVVYQVPVVCPSRFEVVYNPRGCSSVHTIYSSRVEAEQAAAQLRSHGYCVEIHPC